MFFGNKYGSINIKKNATANLSFPQFSKSGQRRFHIAILFADPLCPIVTPYQNRPCWQAIAKASASYQRIHLPLTCLLWVTRMESTDLGHFQQTQDQGKQHKSSSTAMLIRGLHVTSYRTVLVINSTCSCREKQIFLVQNVCCKRYMLSCVALNMEADATSKQAVYSSE